MLLKEQEHKMDALKKEVAELKNLVEELRKESGKRDVSFSMVELPIEWMNGKDHIGF